MKKQILSFAVSAAMVISSAAVFAAENSPSVYVDDSLISFADQAAVIKDDRTLIPARGVFEAMKASVVWDEETRTVKITSSDNINVITLTIDSPVMEVVTFTGLLESNTNNVTLDVAPQILNDRTMIPLRAVSEALKAEVNWSQEEYKVDITTKDKPASKDALPTLSLSAPTETIPAGEEFDVYVNLENITPEYWVSSVSAGVEYDKESFKFVKSELCASDGTAIENALNENNADFSEKALKAISITIDEESASKEDGRVMKLTFKSLTGAKGSFALTNGYNTTVGIGYDTTLLLEKGDANVMHNGNTLNVDTTPVTVNAAE